MNNNKRRFLVRSVWVTPLIMSVSLPAHAQTSICEIADVAGDWEISVEGSTFSVTLNSDQTIGPSTPPPAPPTPDDSIDSWNTFDDNQIRMGFGEGEGGIVFIGTLSNSCSMISGNRLTAGTLTDPAPFTARKL